jgi:hypothetical protein
MTQAEIKKIACTTSLDNVMEIIDRDGAVIMGGLLSDESLADLRGELDPIFERSGHSVGLFYGGKTKRITR